MRGSYCDVLQNSEKAKNDKRKNRKEKPETRRGRKGMKRNLHEGEEKIREKVKRDKKFRERNPRSIPSA